jgi:hypothetical protein
MLFKPVIHWTVNRPSRSWNGVMGRARGLSTAHERRC